MDTRILGHEELIYWRDKIIDNLHELRHFQNLERDPIKKGMLIALESVMRNPLSFIMNALRHPSIERFQVPKYKLDNWFAYICNQVTCMESNLAAMNTYPDPQF